MQRPLLLRWHGFLRLSRQTPSWYPERLREELQELCEAATPLQKLSETADVFYILGRAVHDGHPLASVPPSTPIPHMLVYAYMVPKYTSRWLFYRVAAKLCGSANASQVREVINPSKRKKIGEVAARHGLNHTEFERMKLELGHENFEFYEGSDLISTIVPGGLAAFEKLDEQERCRVRERAITSVAEECLAQNRIALVAGHYMFWPEDELEGNVVATASDCRVYTHIIYLDVPVADIRKRRLADMHRNRPPVSAAHLQKWQQAEIDQLCGRCRQHDILVSVVPQHSDPLTFILKLVRHFEASSATRNLALVMDKVKMALVGEQSAETVLVVDADKTLAGEDAGAMFWQAINDSNQGLPTTCPLKSLFGSPLGYSETAFRQATLLYEESTDEEAFETLCEKIAQSITVHPEFIALFQHICSHTHIRVFVLTCGIRRVWQTVMEKAGFGHIIRVIGGGRIADEIVMTPKIKAEIVLMLQKQAGVYVWAVGDSPLDLPMLEVANRSIVISGDTGTRSRSMDDDLGEAIDTRRLCALQVLLPPHTTPRLDMNRLPLLEFSDPDFLEAIVCHRRAEASPTVSSWSMAHATNTSAAKLLMSPTRDASIAGVALRKAHEEVGKYLALHFVSAVIGVEDSSIPHVQGHQTTGSCLANESQTTIVALMRGGEPMAFGINKVFPRAMFLHAKCPEDIKDHHIENQKNLLLVDSVVNSGKSIMDFLHHVTRRKKDLANIVVVAGVVQEETVADGHALRAMMEQHRVKMVALRVSSNKFQGTKTTDTGNRLFNTTHLA